MINAFCGTDLALEDFLELGKEMLHQEKAFNLKAGIGPGGRCPTGVHGKGTSSPYERTVRCAGRGDTGFLRFLICLAYQDEGDRSQPW
jgi:hypothetical protein